ncbi:hypothetical protein LXA43DRAFT_667247 [Ganoderma leucocontextum]|nr:hypothetical protein LXA43DRAFT_667247 [Ganoderma leucocontextum]
MLALVAALITLLFTQAARATPLASSVTTTTNGAPLPKGFPVRTLDLATLANITRATQGVHSDTSDVTFNPATLFLCNDLSCSTICQQIPLNMALIDECVPTTVFASAGIVQAANSGLPFPVLVGTPECASVAQLPAVNECFNFGGTELTNYDIKE